MIDHDLQTAVWALITHARWFGGKGRTAALRAVTEVAVLPGEPAVSILVAEIVYDDGPVEFYQVPVIGTGASISDATGDPAALTMIMRQLLQADTPAPVLDAVEPGEPGITVRLRDRTGLSPDLPGARFGGEQSNTSIMYGGDATGGAMLKVFRRLELGRNLDIEVHDVIGRSGGPAARDAAHLFGWAEGTWTTSTGQRVTADLAMLVERLTDVHDGYVIAFDACAAGRSFTAEAAALGRSLRHVHKALATSFPTATVDGDTIAAAMRERLDRAARVAPALVPYVVALGGVFAAVTGRSIDVQRIHGDFHLGQVLMVGSGVGSAGSAGSGLEPGAPDPAPSWKIIDFEGEPMKTLAERMAPDARVRDLAGALRSFDYAGTADPSPAGRAWVAACRAALMSGWTGDHGSDHGPDLGTELALLKAYEADKAVYEVVYETRNRPDWVEIPLSGIRALVGSEPPGEQRADQRGTR